MEQKDTKKCNYCGEEVRCDLRRCPFCGSQLEVKVDEFQKDSEPFEAKKVDLYDEKLKTEDDLSIISSNFDEENNDYSKNHMIESISLSGSKPTERTSDYLYNKEPVGRKNVISSNGIGNDIKESILSNGKKVALTTLCTIIPGLGQLVGLIIGIIFINSDEDKDKKSFGKALLISSLIIFVAQLFYCLILVLLFSDSVQQ